MKYKYFGTHPADLSRTMGEITCMLHHSEVRKPRQPLRITVPFWGQTTQISSSLSPKRDCGSRGGKKTRTDAATE